MEDSGRYHLVVPNVSYWFQRKKNKPIYKRELDVTAFNGCLSIAEIKENRESKSPCGQLGEASEEIIKMVQKVKNTTMLKILGESTKDILNEIGYKDEDPAVKLPIELYGITPRGFRKYEFHQTHVNVKVYPNPEKEPNGRLLTESHYYN